MDVSPQLTTWIDTVQKSGSAISREKLPPSKIPAALAEMHSSFERINRFIEALVEAVGSC